MKESLGNTIPQTKADYALWYAEKLGWAVFPLCSPNEQHECSCDRKVPHEEREIGKAPRTKNGVDDATKDPEQIREWWTRWPDANIGVATGSISGILVVDVDPADGGGDSFEELQAKHQIPETWESLTGGGGLHIIFRYPEDETITNKRNLLPGIDIRAEGGYIVAPPSVHVSGRPYAWEASSTPEEDHPLASCPEWLLEMCRARQQQAAAKDLGPFVLDPGAEPPAEKFAALAANHETFQRYWNKDITPPQDPSQSGYDMALACIAVRHGWTDQEIVNLLIAYRRKWNEDMHLRRPDYFQRTIGKARNLTQTQARAESEERALQIVRGALELPVVEVIQRGWHGAQYDIRLDDGTLIRIGTAKELLTFSNVQARIAEATKHVPQWHTRKQWEPVARSLVFLARVEETETEEEETRAWILAFLEEQGIGKAMDPDDPDDKLAILQHGKNAHGFTDKDGRVWVKVRSLARAVSFSYQRITVRQLEARLLRLNFRRMELQGRDQTGRNIKGRFWVSPPRFLDDDEAATD